MTAIHLLAEQPWVERLGWTLVHFLWQGTLIATLYAALRSMAREKSANTRYVLACWALALLLAVPALTWFILRPAETLLATAGAAHPASAHPALTGFSVPVALPAVESAAVSKSFLTWVVGIWLAGAMALCFRLAYSWLAAARLQTRSVRPAPAMWQDRVRALALRLEIIRPVRLVVSAIVQTPCVVGWLRPVVLFPVGALVGLPAEQVEALLMHELAHIRRHDFFVNILQSLAEAVLFYHPAVWWISGQIRAERELCCDDLAVATSGDVLAYASALAEMEFGRPDHLGAVMAANGGSLAHRIGRLVGLSRPAARMASGPGVLLCAALVILTAIAVFGQSAAPLRFEVASIKPNTDVNVRMRRVRPLDHGRLTTTNATLGMLLSNAYELQPYQIIEGPEWMGSDGFSIEAKGDPSADEHQVRLMLRSLLEDRFQLRFHRETRNLPIYTLNIGKSGARLPQPKEDGCVSQDGAAPSPAGVSSARGAGSATVPCGVPVITAMPFAGRIAGGKTSMPQLLRILQLVLGRPVADRTGITGPFDVRLDFARDEVTAGLTLPPGSTPPAEDAATLPPSILSAIQDQLGLKLESAKGPVEVLVIEHVERPTSN
jgi:uncharacterized protein (TIGR03435 family)